MPYQQLTTVQDVADDQTEVASKLNTLISDNYVDTDDIQSVNITPFGENKFHILLTYIGTFWQRGTESLAKIGLESVVDTTLEISRSVSSVLTGILSGTIEKAIEIIRTIEAGMGLGISNSILMELQRSTSAKTGLVQLGVDVQFMQKAPKKVLLGLLLSDIEKASEQSRASLAIQGISTPIFAAHYNGVPIEE